MVTPAGVVELADTPALGAGAERCGGSSPSARIRGSELAVKSARARAHPLDVSLRPAALEEPDRARSDDMNSGNAASSRASRVWIVGSVMARAGGSPPRGPGCSCRGIDEACAAPALAELEPHAAQRTCTPELAGRAGNVARGYSGAEPRDR